MRAFISPTARIGVRLPTTHKQTIIDILNQQGYTGKRKAIRVTSAPPLGRSNPVGMGTIVSKAHLEAVQVRASQSFEILPSGIQVYDSAVDSVESTALEQSSHLITIMDAAKNSVSVHIGTRKGTMVAQQLFFCVSFLFKWFISSFSLVRPPPQRRHRIN